MQIIRWTAWGLKGLQGHRQGLKSGDAGAWVQSCRLRFTCMNRISESLRSQNSMNSLQIRELGLQKGLVEASAWLATTTTVTC